MPMSQAVTYSYICKVESS